MKLSIPCMLLVLISVSIPYATCESDIEALQSGSGSGSGSVFEFDRYGEGTRTEISTERLKAQLDGEGEVEVFFLWGVISYFRQYARLFGDLKAYHGAIGLRHVNSQGQYVNFTIEYWAPDLFQAVFPIVHNPGKDCTIEFLPKAIVSIIDGIDDSLYEYGGEELVAHMSADQTTRFIDWLPTYNETEPAYYLWRVVHPKTKELYIEQHTCFDFVRHAYDYMASFLDVEFIPGAKIQRAQVYIYVDKEPPVVDHMSHEWRHKVCRFYDTFQWKNESIFTEFAEICVLFPDEKFVFSWDQYHLMSLKFPWIGYHYEDMPLPGSVGYVPHPAQITMKAHPTKNDR